MSLTLTNSYIHVIKESFASNWKNIIAVKHIAGSYACSYKTNKSKTILL